MPRIKRTSHGVAAPIGQHKPLMIGVDTGSEPDSTSVVSAIADTTAERINMFSIPVSALSASLGRNFVELQRVIDGEMRRRVQLMVEADMAALERQMLYGTDPMLTVDSFSQFAVEEVPEPRPMEAERSAPALPRLKRNSKHNYYQERAEHGTAPKSAPRSLLRFLSRGI